MTMNLDPMQQDLMQQDPLDAEDLLDEKDKQFLTRVKQEPGGASWTTPLKHQCVQLL